MNSRYQNQKSLLNYSLIILSLCSIVTFIELTVRLLYPELLLEQKMFKNGDFMDSPVLKENLDMALKVINADVIYEVQTNNAGLRMQKELPAVKSIDEKRILCLGDSFTFGFGVNNKETYPFLLEKLLKKRYGSFPLQVINAGFADGWGTDTEYLFLKTKIDKLKPDIVIVGFLMANDVKDVTKNEWIVDNEGLPVNILHPGRKIPRFIKNHSAVYQFLRVKVRLGERLSRLKKNGNSEPEIQQSFHLPSWKKIEKLLLRMNTITKNNNAELIVASFPIQVDITAPESIQAQYDLKIYQYLKDFCTAKSIGFIDLVDAFGAYTRNKLEVMYIPVDGHWTKYGTGACTVEIYKYLESKGKITKEVALAGYSR